MSAPTKTKGLAELSGELRKLLHGPTRGPAVTAADDMERVAEHEQEQQLWEAVRRVVITDSSMTMADPANELLMMAASYASAYARENADFWRRSARDRERDALRDAAGHQA